MKVNTLQGIATMVQKKRENMGITRYKLSKISGVSEHTVKRVELGKECESSTLLKLFNVLEIKIIEK